MASTRHRKKKSSSRSSDSTDNAQQILHRTLQDIAAPDVPRTIQGLTAGLTGLNLGDTYRTRDAQSSIGSGPSIASSYTTSSSPMTGSSPNLNYSYGLSSAPSNRNYDIRNFLIKPRKFFDTPGRVIVVMWSEPAREGLKPSTNHIRQGPRGYNVLQKPRYFIVLRALEQHCIALAINTHGGRGAVDLRDQRNHGIIYHNQQDALPLPGETDLQPIAIRVLPDLNTETLAPSSRINYGKLYTIEYNIAVRPFGMVPRDFLSSLYQQFSAVTGMQMTAPGAVAASASSSTGQSARNTTAQPQATARAAVPTAESVRTTIARLVERGHSIPQATETVRNHLRSQGISLDQIVGAQTVVDPPRPTAGQGHVAAAREQIRIIYERLITEGGLTPEAAAAALQRHLAAQGRTSTRREPVPEADEEDEEDDEEEEEEEEGEEEDNDDEDEDDDEDGDGEQH